MKIEVKIFSFLCKLLGKEGNIYQFNMEIKEGMTCNDLLTLLNIPSQAPVIILVNGTVVEKKCLLEEDNEVSIMPVVAGG